MKTSFLTRLLLAAGIVIGSARGLSAEDLFYYNNGQRVALNVDASRMIVRAASSTTDEAVSVRAVARTTALAEARVQSLGGAGWTLAQTGTAAGGVSAATAGMSKRPGVAFAAPVFVGDDGSTISPTEEILVKYADGVVPAQVLASFGNVGITGQTQIGDSGIWKLTTSLRDGSAVLSLANILNGKKGVVFAEPNFITQAKSSTTSTTIIQPDPLFGQAWGLQNVGQNGGRYGFDVNATSAWDITTGRSTVIVAVLDDGIEQNHPDINQIPGLDFTWEHLDGGNPNPANAYANHGTCCAGIIAGRMNNGLGACGIAPNVRVAAAKIAVPYLGKDAKGNNQVFWTVKTDWLVAALNWAKLIGARVTSNSYSLGLRNASIADAFEKAQAAGIVNFAAAGNDNKEGLSYPASLPSVAAVGAADHYGKRCSYTSWGSNWGTGLAFMAPGESVVTTDRTGSLGYNSSSDYTTSFGGTSAACPFAAGVAALVISRTPTATPYFVISAMKFGCTDMGAAGYDLETGYGMINAGCALDDGDTFSTATPLAFTAIHQSMLYANDVDMFRFTLTAPTTVSISTSGATDTAGVLYNGSFVELARNDNNGTNQNFLIVKSLPAGTYYIKVQGHLAQTVGAYTLYLSRYSPIIISRF